MSQSYTNQLTGEDRQLLEQVGVYLVNVYTNEGWPGTFVSTETVCLTYNEAAEELNKKIVKNNIDYRIDGPHYLLQLFDQEKISLNKTLDFRERIRSGQKHELLPKNLTNNEKVKASKITVYYVWYEDRFHFGGDRDSYAVAVCLTKEEAEVECKKYDRPVGPGTDGYFVEGPILLSNEKRPEIIREVLEKVKSNKSGPILMNKR